MKYVIYALYPVKPQFPIVGFLMSDGRIGTIEEAKLYGSEAEAESEAVIEAARTPHFIGRFETITRDEAWSRWYERWGEKAGASHPVTQGR